MSYPVATSTQRIIIAQWSGHLCLASGTSDLSLCHDGSPTKRWVLCTWSGVHVWQREDSQWISILISRPSAPWYKGNWHISENTMVFKWFIIQCPQRWNTQTHPASPYKQQYTWHTSPYSVKWPIQTKQQEAERLRGWELMNAPVWTTWKC